MIEKLKLKNDSLYVGNHRWKWNVWLDCVETDLDDIKSVTYFLHPTFSNPVHTKNNRSAKFKLSGSGWGEFNIRAEVKIKNDDVISLTHWLTFDLSKKKELYSDVKAKINIYHSITDGPTASVLASILIKKGFRVTAAPIPATEGIINIYDDLKGNEKAPDLSVILISGGMSEFVSSELNYLSMINQELNDFIVPVLLGALTMFDNFEGFEYIHVSSSEQIKEVAETISNLF